MTAKTILIVEDDPVGRKVSETALRNEGFETVASPDIISAMVLAKKHRPDLIVLDLGLPAGGGFTFLERLKGFPGLAQVPVVVVSGLERTANELRAMQAGVVEYIEKPVTPEQIVAAVRKVLGGGARPLFTE